MSQLDMTWLDLRGFCSKIDAEDSDIGEML